MTIAKRNGSVEPILNTTTSTIVFQFHFTITTHGLGCFCADREEDDSLFSMGNFTDEIPF